MRIAFSLRGLLQMHYLISAICSNLTRLPNGMVTYSASDFPVLAGTVATHSCDSGYVLIGYTNRTCMATGNGGEWSGMNVTCRG